MRALQTQAACHIDQICFRLLFGAANVSNWRHLVEYALSKSLKSKRDPNRLVIYRLECLVIIQSAPAVLSKRGCFLNKALTGRLRLQIDFAESGRSQRGGRFVSPVDRPA